MKSLRRGSSHPKSFQRGCFLSILRELKEILKERRSSPPKPLQREDFLVILMEIDEILNERRSSSPKPLQREESTPERGFTINP